MMRTGALKPGHRRLVGLVVVAMLTAVSYGAAAGQEEPGQEAGDPQSTAAAAELATDTWRWPNGDLSNTRHVGGPIDSSSVGQLREAWSVDVQGGYTAGPIILDGVVYTQDMESNVYAIDLASGEVLWTKMYRTPSVGPNGVTVADGRVYGATPTHAFALDAETGRQEWMKFLMVNRNEGIDMAPGYNNGTVYISTVPGNTKGFYEGNGQGVLWALDGATGKTKWTWETVPDDIWGTSKETTRLNSGGGLWYPPGFDDEGNVYASVANPAPWPGTNEFPWGSSRPGPNLYSNSLVKLDGETGELLWYNQVLPHDVYDLDLQLSPVLIEVDGRQVVLTGGKMGYVYAVDAESGELLWKQSVGIHNGHDDDNLVALQGNLDQMPELPVRVYPGTLGGVETQIATNGSTVFAAVNNRWTEYITQEERQSQPLSEASGEMAALDVATGEVKWARELDAPPFGAATVVNDLVFTTTFDGVLWAFDAESGEVVWQADLPTPISNTTVAVAGDTLLTGTPEEIVAYRLSGDE